MKICVLGSGAFGLAVASLLSKNKNNETGYKYESWHLRYVGTDLSYKLYNNGDWISMESYFGLTSKYSD